MSLTNTARYKTATKLNETTPILTTTVLYSTLPYHYLTIQHSTRPSLYLNMMQDNRTLRHRNVPRPHLTVQYRYRSIQANNPRHLTETLPDCTRPYITFTIARQNPYNTSHNIFLWYRNTEQRRDHTITILSGHNRTSHNRMRQNLDMTIHCLLCHTSPWLDDTIPYTTSTSLHLTKRNQTITWLSLTRPNHHLAILN